MADPHQHLPPLRPLVLALEDITLVCWRSQKHQSQPPRQKEMNMADGITETETQIIAHSDWLADVLMAEDGPPPPVVVFQGEPKTEQAALVRIIGQRLREARELCNLSQGEAARRLGYSNSSKLSKVEGATDTSSVPLWLIVRAARLYEVNLEFLFGLADDWDTGAPRGVDGWMLDAWEKARRRDMVALESVRHAVSKMRGNIAALVAGAKGVGLALETYRQRNPSFDDTRASGPVVVRMERLQACVHEAERVLVWFNSRLTARSQENSCGNGPNTF